MEEVKHRLREEGGSGSVRKEGEMGKREDKGDNRHKTMTKKVCSRTYVCVCVCVSVSVSVFVRACARVRCGLFTALTPTLGSPFV